MRVGVVATLLHGGADYRAAGVNTYIRELLLQLPNVTSDHSFVSFQGKNAPGLEPVIPASTPFPLDNPLIRIGWEQLGLPLTAKLAGVDLLHGTVNVLPLMSRRPGVVTVHDLSFLRHPEHFYSSKATYLAAAVKRSVGRAKRVTAVSNHTARDLQEIFQVPEEKIRVVPPGVNLAFGPLPSEEIQEFRQAVSNGRPYLLYVGTLEPRKNLPGLIRAYSVAIRRRGLPHRLMIVGSPGWMYEEIPRLVAELGLQDDVLLIGHVASGDLPRWYNGADLFVYPSAYEGFGLPLLEAMACGVPTITSESSALRELVDGAGVTVAPGSTEELQVAITRVVEDPDLRAKMRAAGLRRAAEFSWEKTARETVAVYEEAVGAR